MALGASQEVLEREVASFRSKHARMAFKVLCHAGAAGMKVNDIVREVRPPGRGRAVVGEPPWVRGVRVCLAWGCVPGAAAVRH